MRVALNLIGLPSTHQGGAGFYAATLARALSAGGGTELTIVAPEGVAAELADVDARLVVAPVARVGRLARAAQLGAAARDPLRFDPHPELAGALAQCELVHYPLGFASGPRHVLPVVVTAVDLQHLEFPRFFSRQDRLLRRVRWHASLRRADRLITFSQFVRESLARHLGIDSTRVDVIAAACHDRFYERDTAGTAPVGPYVLYPASPLPAKNHARLVAAFAEVALDRPELRLVLTGPRGHDWSPVQVAIARHGLARRVLFEGHVPLERLHTLYRHARALVFPSLYEGFGIPVLEAMASGCLVVASRVSSIPELAGEAAVYFDPADVREVADAIRTALSISDEERAHRVAAGRRRADGMRAARLAELTAATYERAVSRSSSG